MKRTMLSICSVALIYMAMIACNGPGNSSKGNEAVDGNKKEYYTCPMDTDIHSNKPDTCSRCGMDLERQIINN